MKTFDELQFEQLLLESTCEEAARQLIESAKSDPAAGMAVIDFVFASDDTIPPADPSIN